MMAMRDLRVLAAAIIYAGPRDNPDFRVEDAVDLADLLIDTVMGYENEEIQGDQ